MYSDQSCSFASLTTSKFTAKRCSLVRSTKHYTVRPKESGCGSHANVAVGGLRDSWYRTPEIPSCTRLKGFADCRLRIPRFPIERLERSRLELATHCGGIASGVCLSPGHERDQFLRSRDRQSKSRGVHFWSCTLRP